MTPEVFRIRYAIWQQVEALYGRPTTPWEMEKRTGLNHGYWTMWANGTGKRKSQMIPSAKHWQQLRLALGNTWLAAFEDVYLGVQEMEIPNRQCPVCTNEFRGKGHQVYDIWFCKVWAARLRDEDKRKTPAAALRAV